MNVIGKPQFNSCGQLTGKKSIILCQFLCCAVYFSSYITRINYAASVSAIVSDLGTTKQLAGLAVTGAFVTYGLGQLVSGALGDRFAPEKVILIGLGCTSLCNILLPFLPGIFAMTVVWCFNGFFQSMLWPPLVRVMSNLFDEKTYKKTCVYVTVASSTATVAVYLLVPLCIVASGWRTTFFITGGIGIAISALWMYGTRSIKIGAKTENGTERASSVPLKSVFHAECLLPVVLAIMLQGMLRDGITTWTPSFITEVFGWEESKSIFTSVILPVFSIVCISLSAWINSKTKGELHSALMFFGVACAASLLLLPVRKFGVVPSVLLLAIITGCAHGINLMLVCNLPGTFTKYGKVSTVSGLLNTFTYVGSAASTYGFAFLADSKGGWGFTIGSWAVTAALGGLMCILCIAIKKHRENELISVA